MKKLVDTNFAFVKNNSPVGNDVMRFFDVAIGKMNV